MTKDIPLVEGAPMGAAIVPFPLARRTAKVRDVAAKLVRARSDRHSRFYRNQVANSLRVHLIAKQVPVTLHAEQIASFWLAVNLEAAQMSMRGATK